MVHKDKAHTTMFIENLIKEMEENNLLRTQLDLQELLSSLLHCKPNLRSYLYSASNHSLGIEWLFGNPNL